MQTYVHTKQCVMFQSIRMGTQTSMILNPNDYSGRNTVEIMTKRIALIMAYFGVIGSALCYTLEIGSYAKATILKHDNPDNYNKNSSSSSNKIQSNT